MGQNDNMLPGRCGRWLVGITMATSAVLGMCAPLPSGAARSMAFEPPLERYVLTPLEGFRGAAINNTGQIAGIVTLPQSVAARWENGNTTLLEPVDRESRALGIDADGAIVGSRETPPDGGHAAIWQPGGGVIDLLPNPSGSSALGINNNGKVVGYTAGYTAAPRATLWSGGNPTLLPDFAAGSYAVAINSSDQVVGYALSGGKYRAVLWDGGTLIDLHPVGLDQSVAQDVNDQLEIVGYVQAPNSPPQAVLWDGGTPIDINPPGASVSTARAVNRHGHIVGTAGASGGDFWALIEGRYYRLRESVAAGDSVHMREINDINDHGQICGDSFLLTPISDLRVSLSASPQPVSLDQQVSYTMNVANHGPFDTDGVRLRTTLPASFTIVSSTHPYTLDGDELTFSLGALANGASQVVTVVAKPTQTGSFTSTVEVEGPSYRADNHTSSNQASAATTVGQGSDAVLTSFTVRPPRGQLATEVSVRGGRRLSGLVSLSGPTLTGPKRITITSSDPSLVPAPRPLTVPRRRSRRTFRLRTRRVSQPTSVDLTATDGANQLTVRVHLQP